MSIHWEDKMLEQVSPRLEIQLISTDGHDNDNLARRLAQHAELQVRMCIYMRGWGVVGWLNRLPGRFACACACAVGML